MMSGRDSKGNFPDDFKPDVWWGPFTEGNSWHWTWCVFHDIRGLITLMGGDQAFVDNSMLCSRSPRRLVEMSIPVSNSSTRCARCKL